MARTTTTTTTAAQTTAAQNVGRWAREAAKAAQGSTIDGKANRAGNRFYSMAVALIGMAPAKGQTAYVSFADLNAATGKRRGEGAANPRAAWVRALSAVAELHATTVEGGTLDLGTCLVRIADDTPARRFEVRGK